MQSVGFNNKLLPYALLAPQIAITVIFFFWPAGQALFMSVLEQDAFGTSVTFVGLDNFKRVLSDPDYLASVWRTIYFSVAVTFLAMAPALVLAVMADRVVRWATAYKTFLIIPYAVAPAVAGAMWLFLFNPATGTIAWLLNGLGVDWNPVLNGTHAMILVIIASAWKQIAYNFLFFLAGLQSIPKSLLEAAAIDGASESRRFWTISFPLLSPVTFFLLVVNATYAFFETFSVIHAVTSGGPAKATEIMVYKVYYDGIIALDLGSSSAQSVILMVIVILLTMIQFKYVGKKVHY
ncbi:sn-glycerol-3-phosphate ABC transporter permease UgpA [Variovorax sp. PCZ-1]|uniref:sn-glycerol-3-phosphate ABC transporter permease UgpA n=1 Tax=Variovorax sp. PCZ-1 TaxID=2835533 RepID=UPI001BCEE453|nr:sn-glycerol-3-phosphate ABC transporter permease UgpA [Variovorax sp. PCZ-1]MBS7808017.1 sn-glycerol-3-phosphate ABC transporter permease UgpA [Variovorax sp. PCZ-1]